MKAQSQLTATCVDVCSPRIDKPSSNETPTGLTVGKDYVVHMYNANNDNNKAEPMIRITNDNNQRASYVARRFNIKS
ncbi:hypothetical protein VPHF86_0201 [Vibrio phage F86]